MLLPFHTYHESRQAGIAHHIKCVSITVSQHAKRALGQVHLHDVLHSLLG